MLNIGSDIKGRRSISPKYSLWWFKKMQTKWNDRDL